MMRMFTTVLALAFAGNVAAAPPQAGKEYEVLATPQPSTAPPGQVEVLEFFSYACPHCFSLESGLSGWRARHQGRIAFARVPALFNPGWAELGRAYYTAETLGVLDKVHDKIFSAIHVERGPVFSALNDSLRAARMRDEAAAKQAHEALEQALAALFEKHAGVSAEAFRNAYGSFAVTAKVQRADTLARRFQITGVPTMIVAGAYKTDGSMARAPDRPGFGRMLEVLDYLVARETAAAAR